MDAINKCNLAHYINWCFDILIQHKEEKSLFLVMKTKLALCSTHFLKSFIKKVKKIDKEKSDAAKTIIFCFSLLQNSISIEQFDDCLLHTYRIFNEKSLNRHFFTSYKKMKKYLTEREMNRIDIGNVLICN